MSEIIDFAEFQRSRNKPATGREYTMLDGIGGARDQFGYDEIMNRAMRMVIREIVDKVALQGFPGQHHLYIKFDPNADGVQIGDHIKARHPTEMTIALKHKFTNLVVTDDSFSVVLNFDGIDQNVVVPFTAVISLVDPHVPFGVMIKPSGNA